MFRISKGAADPIVDVDTLDEIEPVIGCAEPGRYHIDEITRDPLPATQASRRWCDCIKRADGSVMLECDPWPESR
jgi:hypothetical protein